MNQTSNYTKRKKRKRADRIFKLSYLGYVALLVILIIIASFSVRSILQEYEGNQPEYQVESAMKQLVADASSTDGFWQKYQLDEVSTGVYERNVDVRAQYLSLYHSDLNYTVRNGTYPENELHYVIRNDKTELAEVVLRAKGEPITKLAVFSSRVWNIEEIKPIFGTKEYTLQVPDDFVVSANGVSINKEDGTTDENGIVKYTVSGVYNAPIFDIRDDKGNEVIYTIKNSKVIPEYYDYTLTLPYTLKVTVNGVESKGVERENGFVFHEIRLLEKPEVAVSDLYGNTVIYEGKNLDITYTSILAPDTFSVSVNGNAVPEGAVKKSTNPEYQFLVGLVDNLPQQTEYNIAVLQKDAQISVLDSNKNAVELNSEEKYQNLMKFEILDAVPSQVESAVNVLEVAQNWSLYMSNDYSFTNIAKLMLPNSYQYKAAKEYSTSIDRTFFSNHTLLNPAFTENKVSNFTWITEDCFSVEVSFVKHMLLTRTGEQKDDPMNDRFYFVQSNGKWLLAAMKEVVVDAE